MSIVWNVFYAEDMKEISQNGESMSDLRGISEKCADALKMYEPLVVLDDVVVTVDKEKERLYIVSKEDGACKEFKLGDGGIEEKTDEETIILHHILCTADFRLFWSETIQSGIL